MTNQNLKITVIGRKNVIKNGAKAGKTFVSFKAIQNDKKWIDVSFTLGVTNAPKEEGKYILTVPALKCNIDEKGAFPKLWIKEITSIEKVEHVDKVDEKVMARFSEALPF